MKLMMRETQEECRNRLALADRLAEFEVLYLSTPTDFKSQSGPYFGGHDFYQTTEKEDVKDAEELFDEVLQDACNEGEAMYRSHAEVWDDFRRSYPDVVSFLQEQSEFQNTETRRQTVTLLTDMQNFITQYGNGYYGDENGPFRSKWPETSLDCTTTEYDFGDFGKYNTEKKELEFGKYFSENYSEMKHNLLDILHDSKDYENKNRFYRCMCLAVTIKLPNVPTLYAGTVRYENNNRKSGDDVWALNVKNLIVDSETTEIESGTVFIQDTDEGSTLEQVYLQDSAENVPNDAFQKIILSVPERHRGDIAEAVLHVENKEQTETKKEDSPAD